MRTGFLILLLGFGLPAFGKVSKQLVVTVSLSTNQIHILKISGSKKMELTGEILPVMGHSLHTGDFKPKKMRDQFKSSGGNAKIENAVLFDGNRLLRTSRKFEQMKADGTRVSSSIVTTPETGSLLFSEIARAGIQNTVIRVRN